MVKKFIHCEIAELSSVFALLVMSFVLQINIFAHQGKTHSYFWIVLLLMVSGLQYLGVRFKFDLKFLRICMAWVSGVIWMWFSFATLNNILAIPAMCIGVSNICAFINLTNQIKFDWSNFTKE